MATDAIAVAVIGEYGPTLVSTSIVSRARFEPSRSRQSLQPYVLGCNRMFQAATVCSRLQPYVLHAATVCAPGCNRVLQTATVRSRLQPYVPGCNRMCHAATVCAQSCNRMCSELQPYVLRAATVCSRLQPYVLHAVTVCAPCYNRMCSRSLLSMDSRAEKRFRHRPLLTAPHQPLANRPSPFGVTHYLLWLYLLWLYYTYRSSSSSRLSALLTMAILLYTILTGAHPHLDRASQRPPRVGFRRRRTPTQRDAYSRAARAGTYIYISSNL